LKGLVVIVISYKAIKEFFEMYPDAKESLNSWYIITGKSDWANFNELRQMFSSADYVGNGLYVFNTRGGHYRLIARIIFRVRTVFIKFVGTHKEYDRVNLSEL
jgi:mRNA interferase HigB